MHFGKNMIIQSLAGVAFVSVSSANLPAEGLALVEGIFHRRQLSTGLIDISVSIPTDTPSPTDSEESSASPSQTPTPSVDTPTPSEPSSTPPEPESSSPNETSEAPAPTSDTSPAPSTLRTTPRPTSVRTFVTTIVTISEGQTISIPITSSITAEDANAPTDTTAPSLNNGEAGEQSGMSTKQKQLVGGLVGGIGGAILLGGIAVVAYRLLKKRQHTYQPANDDFNNPSGVPLRGEKPDSPQSAYQPAARPNAAANF